MLKKLLVTSGLVVLSTLAMADVDQDMKDCNATGGIYYLGTCTKLAASVEVAGIQMNSFRYRGGNEASIGDHVIQFDGRIEKAIDGKHIKTIFIDISAIPSEEVLNYMQTEQQNQHNENRFRADGYVDRPWLLANLGADISLSENQDLTILAGSFEANGLQPLEGKTSRYYITAPYALIVRYDKGLQFNYELKDKVEKLVSASFSILDGDGIKGQSSVTPSDSRANSYASYSGEFEVQLANSLKKVFSGLEPLLKNHDLYMGVSGSFGETGSYKGEKRTQKEYMAYLGYMVKTSKGEGEVRVFTANYLRNPIGDGSGGHIPLVNSKGSGVEVAWRGFETRSCAWDLYGNAHKFEADDNAPDGEFTWGDVRSVEGWTAGVSCRNFKKIDNLSMGLEYGAMKTYDKDRKLLGDEKIISLVFSYKVGAKNIRKRQY